jgi:hypothetical protein
MDLILYTALIWLAALSWFDIRTRQIPHPVWVAIPFLAGSIYRIVNGGWELSLLSFVVVLASERRMLAGVRHLKNLRAFYLWIPAMGVAVYLAGSTNPISAMAVLGFWIAWELHGWGGADAMVALTLTLYWPDLAFILVFFSVNFLTALIASLVSLIKDRKFAFHQVPGLPLLLLSAVWRAMIGP